MIRFLYGNQLSSHPKLKSSMHKDRATQFSIRLGWDVTVDEKGEEHDIYDDLNPFYIILENGSGDHEGSLRFLPTTGKTMINDHFLELTGGVKICSPHIWECTRFCISPTSNKRTAVKLLTAGAFLMKKCYIDHFVGVFDERMERIYSLIGATPTILGKKTTADGRIGVGLWEFNDLLFEQLLRKAQVSTAELSQFFDVEYIAPNMLDNAA